MIASFIHARGWHPEAVLGPGVVGTAATLGAVVAGAAIIEAALIPGLLIGGAAILAPRLLPRDVLSGFGDKLNSLGDRLRRAAPSPARPPSRPTTHAAQAADTAEPATFDAWQAVVKTLTYRAIVTTLDFGANYVVIGEIATAAGLSSMSLVAGPVAYFAHEAIWHYYGPATARYGNPLEAAVHVRIPGTTTHHANGDTRFASIRVSRALAKTVTYEGVTGVSEFAVNFLFVRNLAAAAGLTAFSMALAPVVYYVHEKLWDYYEGTKTRPATTAPKLLPAG